MLMNTSHFTPTLKAQKCVQIYNVFQDTHLWDERRKNEAGTVRLGLYGAPWLLHTSKHLAVSSGLCGG
jgi:hypothetical protein